MKHNAQALEFGFSAAAFALVGEVAVCEPAQPKPHQAEALELFADQAEIQRGRREFSRDNN